MRQNKGGGCIKLSMHGQQEDALSVQHALGMRLVQLDQQDSQLLSS